MRRFKNSQTNLWATDSGTHTFNMYNDPRYVEYKGNVLKKMSLSKHLLLILSDTALGLMDHQPD